MTATLTMLAGFSGSTVGEEPDGGLIGDANGDVFGTTLAGGAFGGGTVFELVKTAVSTPITLASLDGTSGYGPMVGLIADANGDLFGTASAGGASNHGVGRGERSLTLGTSLRPRRRAAFSALLATRPATEASASASSTSPSAAWRLTRWRAWLAMLVESPLAS